MDKLKAFEKIKELDEILSKLEQIKLALEDGVDYDFQGERYVPNDKAQFLWEVEEMINFIGLLRGHFEKNK